MKTTARRTLLRAPIAGVLYHYLPLAQAKVPVRGRTGKPASNNINRDDDETIILIHGAVADMTFWMPLIPLLSQRYSVMSYALYGHYTFGGGRDLELSPTHGSSYALQRHADDLLRVLDELSPRPVHLAGHDIGSNIALVAAMSRPDSVASLTLANPSEIGFNFDDDDFRAAVRHDKGIVLQMRREWDRGSSKNALLTFLNHYVGVEANAMPAWARSMYVKNAPSLPMLLQEYRQPALIDEQMIERLNTPLCLLSGDQTRASARAVNDSLARRFHQASHALVPGGYLAPIRYPDMFAKALDVLIHPSTVTTV